MAVQSLDVGVLAVESFGSDKRHLNLMCASVHVRYNARKNLTEVLTERALSKFKESWVRARQEPVESRS